MTYYHKELAAGRWREFSFFMQMANIGSEVLRAISPRNKGARDGKMAAERALELLDLTLDDPKNHTRGRLKELWRLREIMADSLFFENEYGSSDQSWNSYFNAFTYAAALERGV